MQKLEETYSNLPKETPSENPEKLDELDLKIEEAAKLTLNALETFELKIDKNYDRKLRYHHGGSINYKVGKTKSQEFSDFIPNLCSPPEETLLKYEVREEIDKALNSLKYEIREASTVYQELGYYP
ncbi:hypothetical protein [Lactovum miscens]|uniref:Uncharacterized protein n=1 Tax=Lactovum miscens TaxID=190387 RepID=A0A841C7B7_9LACT|nr:hypothetical protein [Lactovum miscens]MBB5887628.1 hypothetical protein [Lactovum miscens]